MRALMRIAALTVVAAGLALPSSAAAAPTSWVYGWGDDLNPCSRTAPCATVNRALEETDEGGVVRAIDAGDYGRVMVTKSVTIDLAGLGLIAADNPGENGIVIDAGANDDVVVRGVSVVGNDACDTNGIDVRNAHSVTLEDIQVSGHSTAILIDPNATSPSVLIDRAAVRDNCRAGVDAAPAEGRSASVVVRASTISRSGTGVNASGVSHTWLFGSTITANTVGISAAGGGAIIDSAADTQIVGNATDGTPNQVLGGGPAGLAGATGAQGPTGATGPQGSAGAPAFKLNVALIRPAMTATAGRGVKLAYRTTADAMSTLSVVRGGKVVATVKGAASIGRNTLSWNGRLRGGKRAPAGAYKLKLTAVGSDGQKASKTARLTLKRSR